MEVKEFGKIEEETFFVIDNASSNSSLLTKLYAFSEKNRYIHIILCDRIHKINTLIDELDISGWIIYGKGIIIKNSETVEYYTSLRKKNIIEIMPSVELRKKMSDAAIASTVAYEELDAELAKKVQNRLIYKNRSVADITLDFFAAYNAAAGENTTIVDRLICKT